jgi:uncharacterized protein with PIN domain
MVISFAWKRLKNTEKKRLRCTKCDNPLMLVIWEPVARQSKALTAHHVRVIAKCPICKRVTRIKLGPPN